MQNRAMPRILFRGQDAPTYAVAFSPDGRFLAAGYADGSFQVWNLSSGEPVVSCRTGKRATLSVVFDPDGHHLVSCHVDGTGEKVSGSALVWDWRKAKQLKEFSVGGSAVSAA
jgi:WD40 repeat protein